MPLQKKTTPAKKALTKIVAGKSGKLLSAKNGRTAKPVAAPTPVAPPPRPAPAPNGKPDAKLQLKAFERGIQLLNKRNYREAKESFEKAAQGPALELVSNAKSHIQMCERRLAAPP